MLNPPLSLLSDDLLSYIVDSVAELPSSISNLYNLSITDRAFTRSCQAYIFKDLYLGYGYFNDVISRKLVKKRNILNEKPSFANGVRTVHINVFGRQNKWLLDDDTMPTFHDILQLLAKSLMPPHKLHLIGHAYSKIEDHVLFVGILTQSFFSQTLTVLDLENCENLPLTLFLVCPNLREVYLRDVEVSESRYNEYPDRQCSGRELPALERLKYRNSESLVKQMITPPPKFSMAVIDWSKLRVLELYPQDEEGLMCLQPILDAACNTLEELHLTYDFTLRVVMAWVQVSLAGLVDLRHLSNFHIFTFHAFINCDAHEPVVSRDINSILCTIPNANQVTQLSFQFNIHGKHPFGGCLEQDWAGMCDEVVRVSAGKPLKLCLELSMVLRVDPPPGGDELCERIKEKIAYLLDYPNICTDLWRHT